MPKMIMLSLSLVLLSACMRPFSPATLPNLWSHLLDAHADDHHHHTAIVCALLSSCVALILLAARPRPVYLVDFSCYKPHESCKLARETFVHKTIHVGTFSEENVVFQKKILERSGIGQYTYFPEAARGMPADLRAIHAHQEAQMVVFGAIDDLLAKTRVAAQDISILVVNCSLFGPTPSLSSMVINRYKLRGDVMSYNLSGMGCSAGLLSIDLAKHLLKVHKNCCALIVSTESITLNGYYGNHRSMLVTNCLFRVGGAAVLLSNRRVDRARSKYQLAHLVRVHRGADDNSYSCVLQQEDDQGHLGIALSKDLVSVAGEALKANITTLGPKVLPVSEQLLFLANLAARKLLKLRVAAYVPNFKLAFEHFCIHAGGRAILDELEKRLGLGEREMEPSRMTLYRFGNTSSSSLWYELAYSEAKGRVRRGDRLWQIGFGSGFKCNSVVWRALRRVSPSEGSPWQGEIEEFPVHVPKITPINVDVSSLYQVPTSI